MAKAVKKIETLLLRNTKCDFTCAYANKTDGSLSHSFVKGEVFEVPVTLKRKDERGEEVEVSTLDVLKRLFPGAIEEQGNVVSQAKMKEAEEEIERLKAELAKKDKKEVVEDVVAD